jgi:hypothetical protein
MELTGGAGVSASGREREAYQFGTKWCWAVGLFWSWAASVPRGLLPFFFILLPFLFLNSVLFQIFCIFDSIQCFKPVSNKFSKQNIVFE